MKTATDAQSNLASWRTTILPLLAGVLHGFSILALVSTAAAQVSVKTLGGGPITVGGLPQGFVNGPTLQESQFNHPFGCVLDFSGKLYVADRDNGQIRIIDITGDRARTFLSGLNQPVAVVLDNANNLYVASQGDGTIRKFDSFGNPISVISGLSAPTALSIDGTTNLYVAEFGGSVKRISPSGHVTPLASGLIQPRGIAVMDNGIIAVSENHAIRLIDPVTLKASYLAGGNLPGFTNGPPNLAKFNQPEQIAKAPNGSLVVADRGNQRVRIVDTNGVTFTLYGVDPGSWDSDYPGWEDGSVEFAEARDPVGVAVAKDGTVFTTEVYYHLIRTATGTGLSSVSGTPGEGGGTNNITFVLPPPTVMPNSGYFPMGQDITVTSLIGNVFYTLDASDPTTNSLHLASANNVGIIHWNETLRDLTSLRLKAFDGTNSSVVVSGLPAVKTEIGITRDVIAGIGSKVVVPVVVNLRPSDSFKSIQLRVEVTPNPGTTSMISDQFDSLSVSTNDFIPVVTSSGSGGKAVFSSSSYRLGTTRGLAISFIGTNANFTVKNFAVVAMLAIPVPATANPGDSYRISVLEPSGTSDAQQSSVDITPMTNRNIIVSNLSYTAGDSSFAGWYNAGDFGNHDLKNNDVNNAFHSSLGVRVPYEFSDLFNAMDVFPIDATGNAGGDGQIRFLDWQIILDRSLRLDPDNWTRSWNAGGLRLSVPTTLGGAANRPADSQLRLPGDVWSRPVLIGAAILEKINPDSVVEVPIYVNVAQTAWLSGLQFRAAVIPDGNAPGLLQQALFIPALGIRMPRFVDGLPANEIACAWSLGAFDPPLQGSNVLGYLRFHIPVNAPYGGCYTVKFSNADGSPDPNTQYDFETLPGGAWVQTGIPQFSNLISDEWKTNFFGTVKSPLADPAADPDGDGIPNWSEYLAGTDPANPHSRLELLGASSSLSASSTGFKIRWLSAPGKSYILECTSNLISPNWKIIAENLAGSGDVLEFIDANNVQSSQFYRIRVSP